MIIDATDMIVGRLSTYVAKQALLGEKVDIINCEKAVISGERREIIGKYKQRWNRTTIRKGPYLPRMPDRFLRRIIRGMLPHKQEKGLVAYKRILCYQGIPPEFEGKQYQKVPSAHLSERQPRNTVKISDICQELGAKI